MTTTKSRIEKHEKQIDALIHKMPNTIETYDYLLVEYTDRPSAESKRHIILRKIRDEISKKYKLDYSHFNKMASLATHDHYEELERDYNDYDE